MELTWEGVVATAALLVSLYNLRQARRAPALARQRELRDQLRILLELATTDVQAVRDGIRSGAEEMPSSLYFHQQTQKLEKIRARLMTLGTQVEAVEVRLNKVGAHCSSVTAAQQRNSTRELLSTINLTGVPELPAANVDVEQRDLDDACKDALSVIASTLGELNRLESR
jgi:hypothetical protein